METFACNGQVLDSNGKIVVSETECKAREQWDGDTSYKYCERKEKWAIYISS
jgi:hypothetical protein